MGANPLCLDEHNKSLLDIALDENRSNIAEYLVTQHTSLLSKSSQLEVMCEKMPNVVRVVLPYMWHGLPRFIYYVNRVLYIVFVVLLTHQIIIGQNKESAQHWIKSPEIAHNTSPIEKQLFKFKYTANKLFF